MQICHSKPFGKIHDSLYVLLGKKGIYIDPMLESLKRGLWEDKTNNALSSLLKPWILLVIEFQGLQR